MAGATCAICVRGWPFRRARKVAAKKRTHAPVPLPPVPDYSPEARRERAAEISGGWQESLDRRIGLSARFWHGRFFQVLARVWSGAYHDGFIHAGNFAYMAILALFPFFITVGAAFSALGEAGQRAASVHAFLAALPPAAARTLEPVARDVIQARHGWLLWAGGVVGLWTVGSLIETIRDLLRRAYGTQPTLAFWRYRLISTGVIIVAVAALLFALIAQVAFAAAMQMLAAELRLSPALTDQLAQPLALSRIALPLIIYGAMFLLFITLTPREYRGRRYPKWPGALLVTGWWVAVSIALPLVLARFFSYDLTYGSLAGVMIALFFFWLIGLGMVVGAELNAALAVSPEERDQLGQSDNRARGAPAAISNEKDTSMDRQA